MKTKKKYFKKLSKKKFTKKNFKRKAKKKTNLKRKVTKKKYLSRSVYKGGTKRGGVDLPYNVMTIEIAPHNTFVVHNKVNKKELERGTNLVNKFISKCMKGKLLLELDVVCFPNNIDHKKHSVMLRGYILDTTYICHIPLYDTAITGFNIKDQDTSNREIEYILNLDYKCPRFNGLLNHERTYYELLNRTIHDYIKNNAMSQTIYAVNFKKNEEQLTELIAAEEEGAEEAEGAEGAEEEDILTAGGGRMTVNCNQNLPLKQILDQLIITTPNQSSNNKLEHPKFEKVIYTTSIKKKFRSKTNIESVINYIKEYSKNNKYTKTYWSDESWRYTSKKFKNFSIDVILRRQIKKLNYFPAFNIWSLDPKDVYIITLFLEKNEPNAGRKDETEHKPSIYKINTFNDCNLCHQQISNSVFRFVLKVDQTRINRDNITELKILFYNDSEKTYPNYMEEFQVKDLMKPVVDAIIVTNIYKLYGYDNLYFFIVLLEYEGNNHKNIVGCKFIIENLVSSCEIKKILVNDSLFDLNDYIKYFLLHEITIENKM